MPPKKKSNRTKDVSSAVRSELASTKLVRSGKVNVGVSGSLLSQVDSYIPSQCQQLDWAMGVPGYPVGRIVEILGVESGGKTTMILHALAQVQKIGGVGVLFDNEYTLDEKWAGKIGVNTKSLITLYPNTLQTMFSMAQDVIQRIRKLDRKKPILMVLDSLSSIKTDQEEDADYGDRTVATHAQVMSMAMRKFPEHLAKHNVAFIIITQLRDRVGVKFGTKVTTIGGRALRFHASIRIHITHQETVIGKKRPMGAIFRFKIIKNRMDRPFRTGMFYIDFAKGGQDNLVGLYHWAIDEQFVDKIRGEKHVFHSPTGKDVEFNLAQWPALYKKYEEEFRGLYLGEEVPEESEDEELGSEDENE